MAKAVTRRYQKKRCAKHVPPVTLKRCPFVATIAPKASVKILPAKMYALNVRQGAMLLPFENIPVKFVQRGGQKRTESSAKVAPKVSFKNVWATQPAMCVLWEDLLRMKKVIDVPIVQLGSATRAKKHGANRVSKGRTSLLPKVHRASVVKRVNLMVTMPCSIVNFAQADGRTRRAKLNANPVPKESFPKMLVPVVAINAPTVGHPRKSEKMHATNVHLGGKKVETSKVVLPV